MRDFQKTITSVSLLHTSLYRMGLFQNAQAVKNVKTDVISLISRLEAAEREHDELRKVLQETQVGLIDAINHASQLQADLSRRDAADRELLSDELSRLREWVKCVEAERDKAISWHSSLLEKHDKLQAEIDRRDAAAGEPVAWQYRYNDGKVGDWKTVDSESECNHSPCYERRPIYTAAPPAVLPPPLDNWNNSASGVMHSLNFIGDQTSFTVGANWMRQQCLELGAQPQKVVELKTDWVVRKGKEPCAQAFCNGYALRAYEDKAALDAAGVKWEVKK